MKEWKIKKSVELSVADIRCRMWIEHSFLIGAHTHTWSVSSYIDFEIEIPGNKQNDNEANLFCLHFSLKLIVWSFFFLLLFFSFFLFSWKLLEIVLLLETELSLGEIYIYKGFTEAFTLYPNARFEGNYIHVKVLSFFFFIS